MPRRTPPQQLDLFDPPCAAGSLPTPQWQSLPDKARLTLTTLMTPPDPRPRRRRGQAAEGGGA